MPTRLADNVTGTATVPALAASVMIAPSAGATIAIAAPTGAMLLGRQSVGPPEPLLHALLMKKNTPANTSTEDTKPEMLAAGLLGAGPGVTPPG